MTRETIKRKIRHKIFGTTLRPRVAVYRSINNIFLQAIDDSKQMTIASASSLKAKGALSQKARQAGEELAEKLKKMKIKVAVFDRGGFSYHGSVKIVAETLREKGILV